MDGPGSSSPESLPIVVAVALLTVWRGELFCLEYHRTYWCRFCHCSWVPGKTHCLGLVLTATAARNENLHDLRLGSQPQMSFGFLKTFFARTILGLVEQESYCFGVLSLLYLSLWVSVMPKRIWACQRGPEWKQ